MMTDIEYSRYDRAHLVFDIDRDYAGGARRVAFAVTAIAAEGKLRILIVCHKMYGHRSRC